MCRMRETVSTPPGDAFTASADISAPMIIGVCVRLGLINSCENRKRYKAVSPAS